MSSYRKFAFPIKGTGCVKYVTNHVTHHLPHRRTLFCWVRPDSRQQPKKKQWASTRHHMTIMWDDMTSLDDHVTSHGMSHDITRRSCERSHDRNTPGTGASWSPRLGEWFGGCWPCPCCHSPQISPQGFRPTRKKVLSACSTSVTFPSSLPVHPIRSLFLQPLSAPLLWPDTRARLQRTGQCKGLLDHRRWA